LVTLLRLELTEMPTDFSGDLASLAKRLADAKEFL
jgi:hypothetical protein